MSVDVVGISLTRVTFRHSLGALRVEKIDAIHEQDVLYNDDSSTPSPL